MRFLKRFSCLLFSLCLIASAGMPVTAAEKALRSTARAPPASTRVASAQDRIRESRRRSSSFKRPTAFSSWSLRRELEQQSSAKYSVSWAGVFFSGFISRRVTWMPRLASCQAASLPARPAPITVTCMGVTS